MSDRVTFACVALRFAWCVAIVIGVAPFGTTPNIGPADIEILHQAGYTDEAIYYAITVCALFNFYNRWIDAAGVHAMSDEVHREGGKRSARAGYTRTALNE